MQASTLQRIIPIAASVLNLDAVRDRAEILREIDDCRHLMFSGLGPAVREAFFVREICLPVRRFSKHCGARCGGAFFGFSLPADCVKAEVFRIGGERVDVVPRYGGSVDNYRWVTRPNCPEALDLGDGFSLPCDPEGPFNLGFRIDCPEAPKKPLRVGVCYIDLNGDEIREDIDLTNTVTFASNTVAGLSHRGISLPSDVGGMVEVHANGKILATLHPGIAVPSFHRFAITPDCQRGEIDASDALFEPAPAMFDTDVVETGDPNFWRSVIQWKALHFKNKRNGPENNSYQSLGAFLVQHGSDLLEMKQSSSEILVFEPENAARDALNRINSLRSNRPTHMGFF